MATKLAAPVVSTCVEKFMGRLTATLLVLDLVQDLICVGNSKKVVRPQVFGAWSVWVNYLTLMSSTSRAAPSDLTILNAASFVRQLGKLASHSLIARSSRPLPADW